MTKSEYRKFYKNVRKNIDDVSFIEKSNKIFEYLIDMDVVNNAKTIFVYLSYNREVSTEKIIDFLLEKGKTVLIPKCDIQTETMIAVQYTDKLSLIDGSYGIKEPICSNEFSGDIDLVIVPGIAFDQFGNRIGYGKGYYDKFLKNKNICKIALSHKECICDFELPHDNEDITMDYIVSDRGVLKI